MISSRLKTANLITLLSLLACCIYFSVSLGRWLNPAPSDIRLSLAQTSVVETSMLPQKALDNHMPQLGKAPYWVDGKLMQTMGKYSPYVVRYLLFLISLALMFYLFLRYIKPDEDDPWEWSLFFLMTIAGSYFFMIKFFYWLDYLAVFPFTLLLVILMRKDGPMWAAFLLVIVILYLKISALFIMTTFFGIFGSFEDLKKYKVPLASGIILSISGFFLQWGLNPIGDRGQTFMIDFPGYALTGLNQITRPWIIFSIFDKSVQRLVTEIDVLLILKSFFYTAATAWLLIKKIPGTNFRLMCIGLTFTAALVLLRNTPTIHDFAAYNGVVELGCLSLFWIVYRYSERKMRVLISGIAIVAVILQFTLWNLSFKDLDVAVSKSALTEMIMDATKDREKKLFLFCASNVGEFEYFLGDVQIHYSLWEEPVSLSRPAILLIPERCQHETLTEGMNRKYAAILEQTGARQINNIQIDRNQAYVMYEVK